MVRRPSTLLREPYVGTAQPCGTSVHVRYAAPVPKRLGVDVVRPWSAWWGRPGRCCVFSSLMWPRRRRARPSTSYLCKLSVLVTLLLTMKAYRALHRCHPPAHTKLHGCSPVYVLLPSYIPYTPHPLTAHTHHRRQLGGLNRDVAGDSGVDLLVPGCAMWFSMIMWGTCVVFIPSKLTARGPTPLSRPSSLNAVLE